MTDNGTVLEAGPVSPIIFLLGPPGAGKSALGSRACRELGLEFLDLGSAPVAETAPGDRGRYFERLTRVVAERVADVIELPWELQHDREALVLARKSGVTLLLWAHPEDTQARSGHDERLFTPVSRLKVRSGFGRTGTGCREFRHLDRACEETLDLVDLPFEEAVEVLRDCIVAIREQTDASTAEREALAGWVEDWRHDYGASPRVAKVIVDAMARYLAQLRASGCSPRTQSAIQSDLNAAGCLVLAYDVPRAKRVLECFDGPPWEIEFERKFTESPALVSRYRRSLEGFARFLRESGEIPNDDE